MKQFREFKSQQQVVNEIGPVGATIATVMGIVGGAMALKKGLDKFKGYRESQREKKSDGPPDVPEYHREAAEADFFAGGGFFGASSGAITGLGSDDDSDGLLEVEDGLEEIVEDTYE